MARLLSLVLLLLASGTAWGQSTAPEGGTLNPATSTVCAGINSGTLTLSGYAGTIVKYQFDNGSGYTDIANTAPTYTYQNLQASTNFRAIVSTSSGVLVASTVAAVTVNSAPTATITASSATTFCKQGNLFLSAGPTGSGFTYQFLLNGNPIAGATGQTYSELVTNSGNYSVRVTNAFGCSATSPSVAVTVESRNVVDLTAATTTTFCQGGSVLLSAKTTGPGASDYTYQYYRNDVPVSGATASTYTATTSGSYTVVVYNPSTCTSTSNAIIVTVQPLANSSVSYPAPSYCQNAGTNPAPTVATTGGTFTASPSGLGISATTGVVNLAASTPGTYTVTYSVGGTCPSSSTTTLTINAATTATFSYSATSFCQSGAAATPTITGTAGGTFSSTTGLSLNAGTGTITPSASTPGTYAVTYSVGGPCPSSATASVTITAAPVATFSYATGSNCAGTTGTVAVTLASGASAGTFTSATGLALNASTGAVDLSTSMPGTYTVTNTIAAANGCAATSATATLTINAVPAPTLTAGGATTFCQGGSVTLTATGGATGAAYQFLLNGQAITGATSATYVATASGSYTVTITNVSGCAATSAAVAVTVTPLPSAAFSYGAAAYCLNAGTNPTATVTGATGGTFSSTTGLSLNTTTGEITLATSTPGTYTVTYSVGGTCPNSSTQAVTLTAPASAGFTYAAAAYCTTATNPTPALASGASAGTFTSTTGLTINATTGAITLATSTPGTYIVTNTVAAAGGCAAATATATLTINAAPTPTLTAGGATTFCQGGSVTLTAAGGATGATYQFLLNGQPIAGATTSTYKASTAGAYSVAITNPSSCAATSAATTVTVNAIATPTVSYTAASFCQGGANPAPTVSIAGGTFASTTGLTLDATTGVIALGTSTPGTYTVTYTGGSPCPGSGTTTVTVAPLPSAAFAYGATTYCQSGATNPTATVTGMTGGTFSSTAGLGLNATTGEIILASSTPGTYTVTYSVGGTCPNSSTATVTVTNPAVATFSYTAAAYCLGTTATSPVPALATGATAGTFSASPTGLVLNASTGAIDLATSQAGTYTVTNTVAAAGGCSASSATASLTLTAAPARPVLTAAYNGSVTTLTSSSATGNQFYFNGAAIAGATAQTYVVNGAAAQLGSYTVVATNAGGCASPASAPLVVTAALRPLAGTALNVYPNPTRDGRLTLELSGYRKATELTVLNALGQVVRRTQVPVAADGTLALPLDLSALPQGVYTLRLLTEGGTATRRIVRE